MAGHRMNPPAQSVRWSVDHRRHHLGFRIIGTLAVCLLAAPAALVALGPPLTPRDGAPEATQPEAVATAQPPKPEPGAGIGAGPSTGGGESPPTRAPAPRPLRVALVGDSLLAGAESQIRETLVESEIVGFDGRNATTIGQQRDAAVSMVDNDPDVLVVVLGANDAGPDFTREAMEAEVKAFLDAVSHARCIKWVTVQEDFYLPDTHAGSHGTLTLNVTLFREAADRTNLEVIDFAPIINEQPDWHEMDILHLDDRGDRALAEEIARSLTCGQQATVAHIRAAERQDAPDSSPPPIGPVGPTVGFVGEPTVGFVGDSLLLQAEVPGKIRPRPEPGDASVLSDEAAAAGWRPAIHADAGDPIQSLRAGLRRQLDSGADVIVLAGGTNDVRIAAEQDDPESLDRSATQTGAAVDELAAAPCGVVFTLNTNSAMWRLTERGPVVNDAIHSAAARYDNVHVYDWDAVATAGPTDWMGADGVHLTTEGEAAYREALLDAADLCR